jgi:hypothetical protein
MIRGFSPEGTGPRGCYRAARSPRDSHGEVGQERCITKASKTSLVGTSVLLRAVTELDAAYGALASCGQPRCRSYVWLLKLLLASTAMASQDPEENRSYNHSDPDAQIRVA